MNLLIKNTRIVSEQGIQNTNVFLSDGKIAHIGVSPESGSIDRIIDAKFKILLPGGIDPHVHLHLPTQAGFSSDDFLSGSVAALMGGTTTIIDFVTPQRGQSMLEALEIRIAEAVPSLVDYSFHVSPVEWRNTTEEEIQACVRAGFPSFKVYLAYKSSVGINVETFRKVLSAVAKAGGMVTVHAEMGDEVDCLRDNFVAEGNTHPMYHPLSRPPKTESDAVKMAIELASETGCPLYIVHVSSAESLEHIRRAQQRGQKVFAETCPHYLLLNDSVYSGNFNQVAPFVLSPPLRKTTDVDALWRSISAGTVQTIGTDHCPFNLEQKAFGKTDFRKIPNGAGGIEHRLSLLYSYGVVKERICWDEFVAVTASNSAQIFKLSPAKGTISVGADADLVLWNSDKKSVISAKTHISKADTEIFEGFRTFGAPELVIKGGEVVVDKGRIIDNTTQGKLLRRF
jgi:dihydropyrimidinase